MGISRGVSCKKYRITDQSMREGEREREQPVDIIQLMDRNYIIIPEPCDGYSDWIGKSLY